MSDSKSLRDAAAILLAEADKLDGKSPSTFFGVNLNDPKAAWASLLAQYAAEDADNAEEFEIGRIVTAYNPVIQAAHRERWPSNLGGTYWVGNYKTARALKESLIALMQTEQYKAWAAHPLNANLVPKAPPV